MASDSRQYEIQVVSALNTIVRALSGGGGLSSSGSSVSSSQLSGVTAAISKISTKVSAINNALVSIVGTSSES